MTRDTLPTQEQIAHDAVLTWCCSQSKPTGMRSWDNYCAHPITQHGFTKFVVRLGGWEGIERNKNLLAYGDTWVDVATQLGLVVAP